MNALLVDDERLARQELRRLLQAHADVTIVGEAANADEAVARLSELLVDVVFLDIQMPGASGFDVLERLDHVPLVLFTTAFDDTPFAHSTSTPSTICSSRSSLSGLPRPSTKRGRRWPTAEPCRRTGFANLGPRLRPRWGAMLDRRAG